MTIPTAEQLSQMSPEHAIGLLLSIIADLQQQLLDRSPPPKDSSNSSKPPASDIVPRTRSLRRPSGKKPGGQPGHRGFTRRLTETPDLVQVRRPSCCSGCGGGLDESLAGTVVERRQVIDLPPIRAITTEYRALAVTCPHCRKATVGQFPPPSPRRWASGRDSRRRSPTSATPTTCPTNASSGPCATTSAAPSARPAWSASSPGRPRGADRPMTRSGAR